MAERYLKIRTDTSDENGFWKDINGKDIENWKYDLYKIIQRETKLINL